MNECTWIFPYVALWIQFSLLSSEEHLSPECQPVFGFVARHFPDDPVAFINALLG